MSKLAPRVVLALGIAGALGASWALLPIPREEGVEGVRSWIVARLDKTDLRNDPRVGAFVEAYGPLIDSVTYTDDDVIFAIGSRPIHFQGGRMLEEEGLDRSEDCDPIFYRYSLEPLTEPSPLP